MPLPCKLSGFETPQKHFFFFHIFAAKEQKERKKNQKFWGEIENLAKKSGKIRKIWYNRISVEISYRSPSITEISEILFLAPG